MVRDVSVSELVRNETRSGSTVKGMEVSEVERWLAPNLGYEV